MSACSSQKIVFVGSEGANEVEAIEPGSNTHRGGVTIPNTSSADRALLLREDGQLGYVRGDIGTIHAIDLTASPPALQGAPTVLSTTVDDIAEVNLFLIVAAGRDKAPGGNDVLIASALPAAQREVDVLNLGPGNSVSIDVCDDNSTVLIALRGSDRAVRKITINDAGELTDTGQSFRPSHPPATVHCAPGSQSGMVVGSVGATAQTFTTATLTVVDTQPLAAAGGQRFNSVGHSAAFNAAGGAVYVMSSIGDFTGRGYVERFDYTPSTGVLGNRIQATVEPVARTTQGIQLLDVGPDDQYVYVTEWGNDRVLVLSASTLTPSQTITGLNAPIAIDVGGE
jgi:YVTN family beta-propeller protein